MSSDNYFMIKVHPKGGFTVVQGFSSDEHKLRDAHDSDYQVKSLQKAIEIADGAYSEYGYGIHHACFEVVACYYCGDKPRFKVTHEFDNPMFYCDMHGPRIEVIDQNNSSELAQKIEEKLTEVIQFHHGENAILEKSKKQATIATQAIIPIINESE